MSAALVGFASPAILSNRNVTLGLKKNTTKMSRKEAARLGIQPEPSGPSPAGAEGARAKSDLTAVREGTWCGSSLWLSPLHPKGVELLELTNFCLQQMCHGRAGRPQVHTASPCGALPDVPPHSLYRHLPRLNVFCHRLCSSPFSSYVC